MDFQGDSRSETMQGSFYIGGTAANELDSPLMRLLPWVSCAGLGPRYLGPPFEDDDPAGLPSAESQPVGMPVRR